MGLIVVTCLDYIGHNNISLGFVNFLVISRVNLLFDNRNLELQCSYNNCMYCVLLHLLVMMLIIIATPCGHMACHRIIMGD